MSAGNTMLDLSRLIADNVASMHLLLEAHNFPTPSFGLDTPALFPKDEKLDTIRDTILSAITELRALNNQLVSLNAISRFNLASSFPVGQEATYGEIAQKTSLNETTTRRILRHAMTEHIFTETNSGAVAHTAASKLLAEDADARDLAAVAVEDLWRASTCAVDALEKWPNSEEGNQTGFSITNNSQDSLFTTLGRNPKRIKRFAGAMRALGATSEYSIQDLVQSFDWASLGDGLVVDVGGSQGSVSLALAKEYPRLRFMVQDLERVITARPKLPEDEVSSRVNFMAHDYFQPQPVAGADAYYFRWVFHSWAKGYCVKILQSLVPALKKGSWIILNEICVPEKRSLSVWKDRRIRQMDMAQLVLMNSGEREAGEWQEIFQLAHENYEFKGVREPPASSSSFLSVIVAQWKGD